MPSNTLKIPWALWLLLITSLKQVDCVEMSFNSQLDALPIRREYSVLGSSSFLEHAQIVSQRIVEDTDLCAPVNDELASTNAKHNVNSLLKRASAHAGKVKRGSSVIRAIIRNPKYVQNPKWTTITKPTPKPTPTLPGSPASTCNPMYTNTAAGAVYGPGIGSFPMQPRPSTFVTRSGKQLYLDGQPFRITGPNVYWLGLDENPYVAYPDNGRVREAMAMAVAMGANTIRSHTLGTSTGRSESLWPRANAVNYNAYKYIDYAIWAARDYGLRLIIVLTDEYKYFHGGKYDFLGWAGADTSNGYNFYTDGYTRQLYKQYISTLLNHVNIYTGVALKNDPTILGWETINEGGAYMLQNGAPTAEWTNDIATYIKSLAPNHLVIDGTNGLFDANGNFQNKGTNVAAVDIITDHFYPAMQWLLQKDQAWMSNVNKVFLIGELDWTGTHGGDDLYTFYRTIESFPGAGSIVWSLFGHDAQCCNYVQHNDGYSLYYPNGMSNSLQSKALLLIQHWNRLRGLSPPSAMPAVACPQPTLA